MIDFLPAIAQITHNARFDAIVSVLKEHNVPYKLVPTTCYGGLGYCNIIVTFNPESAEPKTVISAHYDNAPGTPGANDNAAACSILLNLILAVKEKGTKDHLEFVFFDLEESGFIGSNDYALKNWKNLRLVYNLDMCGMGNHTVAALWKGAREMLTEHLDGIEEVDFLPPGDAQVFQHLSIPTVFVVSATDKDLVWFREYAHGRTPREYPDFARTMHRPGDTPDTCNRAHMEEIYNWLLACLGI